ncbi:MAG: 3-deoxy-D-manno-octulosonic acid transferase [Rickettsiaceae bacterium]|nr:3-deoxy-D-manno-octulosonic acid transferase [Rickettsiaceae bacterium]
MLFQIYNIITILLIPIYCIVLVARLFLGKESHQSIMQRFGFGYDMRPEGKLVWLHAASVGESMVAVNLVKLLSIKYPCHHFLITTTTISSSKILKQNPHPNLIHQFVPADNFLAVKRFINYWQPCVGIFIESELWPCLINITSKKTKLLLVNGKLSDISYKLWKKAQFLFNEIISKFEIIITQSDNDLQKFQNLGYHKAIKLDNLKFINGQLAADLDKLLILRNQIGNKPVLVFASTHLFDENIILKVISNLKNKLNYYPILVPRYPHLSGKITEMCQALGLSYSLRSKQQDFIDKDLYIIDSFSELGLFYRISKAVFVGGSFNGKGHNMIEPAYLDNVILFGPHVSSFQNIADEMIENEAAIQVHNESELEERIKQIFSTKAEFFDKYAVNALSYVNSKKANALKTIEYIERYLND